MVCIHKYQFCYHTKLEIPNVRFFGCSLFSQSDMMDFFIIYTYALRHGFVVNNPVFNKVEVFKTIDVFSWNFCH